MLNIRNRSQFVVFVVLSSLAAVSASCILASLTYEIFDPVTERASLLQVIFISALVSVPIASMLAVHSMRVTEYQSELEGLANTDGLTGLHNRRRFLELLPDRERTDEKALIAFVDLDRFKSINDRFGHAVGDEVVTALAERLQAVRPRMEVARLGGDEFALIITQFGNHDILERIRIEISRPVKSSVGPIFVGASIGAARFPEDCETASDLLRAADRAMLRAKSDGGGICWFDPRHDAETTDEHEIEARLRSVIADCGITPAYQPISCAQTGAVLGHEVLARWTADGFDDPPSPGRFIPIAERAGLIDDMFWSILDQVLAGPAAQAAHGTLAVNVSPVQLQHGDFASRLGLALARHGFDPRRLELEVTETAMFRDMETGIATLQKIAGHGVSIALDDFGTGHSSLSLVRQLPLSKLKIDRSFVASLTWSDHSESIVSATVGLCRALSLKTCAEGVEDERTLARLRTIGCDFLQGNHLGRPAASPKPCEPAPDEAEPSGRTAIAPLGAQKPA